MPDRGRGKTGYVNPGSFCHDGDEGETCSGTRMSCTSIDGKRSRWRKTLGAVSQSRIRKRTPRTAQQKAADKLRPSEINAMRAAGGLPQNGPLPRQKRQYKKLTEAGFLDDQGNLTAAGREALRRRGALDDTSPAPTPASTGHVAKDTAARSGWKPGDRLVHDRRGPCTYHGPDDMDGAGRHGAGGAQWVEFDDGDSGMVSATGLSGYVPEDHSADAGTDWSRYGDCEDCDAAAGQPCRNLLTRGLNAHAHAARPMMAAPAVDDDVKVAAARKRQDDIDTARAAAAAAAKVDEDRFDADPTTNPAPDPDAWKAAEQAGAERVGAAGDVEPFDPARHDVTGERPAPGAPVTILRPGAEWTGAEPAVLAKPLAVAGTIDPPTEPPTEPATEPAPPVRPVSGAYTEQRAHENRWGHDDRSTPVAYHPDGPVGRVVDSLGGDRRLDMGDGESLENRLNRVATRMARGEVSFADGVNEYRRIRDALPEGSPARGRLDRTFDQFDGPVPPPPELPENTPEPVRRLMKELNDIPMARTRSEMHGRDPDTKVLAQLMGRYAGRDRVPAKLLADRLRSHVLNRHHESYGDVGKFHIDAAVQRACKDLEGSA
jgi:hypothetical protein